MHNLHFEESETESIIKEYVLHVPVQLYTFLPAREGLLVPDSVDGYFIARAKYPRYQTATSFKEFHQCCFQWKISLGTNRQSQLFITIGFSGVF